ncbi:MAG: DUF2497 domain-containing protein [Emcibacteraceae bacterium]
MSQPGKEEEPSMEEILASIRRIISEDDDAAPENDEAVKEETPEVKLEAEPEPQEEEVLELTENDLEEASQDDIDSMFDSVEDKEDELVMEDKAEAFEEQEEDDEPAPEPASSHSDDFDIDDVDPAEGKDVLMSEEVSSEIQGRFDALSALLTSGYQGSGNTLEDLVRELLRPMLKKWLEENLPPLAERMVAKEIARLARTKKP